MEKTRQYVKIILITKKRSLTPISAVRWLRGIINQKKLTWKTLDTAASKIGQSFLTDAPY